MAVQNSGTMIENLSIGGVAAAAGAALKFPPSGIAVSGVLGAIPPVRDGVLRTGKFLGEAPFVVAVKGCDAVGTACRTVVQTTGHGINALGGGLSAFRHTLFMMPTLIVTGALMLNSKAIFGAFAGLANSSAITSSVSTFPGALIVGAPVVIGAIGVGLYLFQLKPASFDPKDGPDPAASIGAAGSAFASWLTVGGIASIFNPVAAPFAASCAAVWSNVIECRARVVHGCKSGWQGLCSSGNAFVSLGGGTIKTICAPMDLGMWGVESLYRCLPWVQHKTVSSKRCATWVKKLFNSP